MLRIAREALRCVRGTRADLSCIRIQIARTVSHPRGTICPSFAVSRRPQKCRGRREGRVPAGTRGPLCEDCATKAAQRHTGEAKHPAFPAQWFYGLCRALPGERCTIAPVALRMADARARSGRHITARLGAQTPGARTTRFCRTQVTPVVCATPSLTVARPAKPFAPMRPASTTSHPAFVTIAIRPSAGLGWSLYDNPKCG